MMSLESKQPINSLPTSHQSLAAPGSQPTKAKPMKRTFQQHDTRFNPFPEPNPGPPLKKTRFILESAHIPSRASEVRQNSTPSIIIGRFDARIGLPIATQETKMKDVGRILRMDDQHPRLGFPAKKLFRTTPSLSGFADSRTRPGDGRLPPETNRPFGIGNASSRDQQKEARPNSRPDQVTARNQRKNFGFPAPDPIKCVCKSTNENLATLRCQGCNTRQHVVRYYGRTKQRKPHYLYCGECPERQSRNVIHASAARREVRKVSDEDKRHGMRLQDQHENLQVQRYALELLKNHKVPPGWQQSVNIHDRAMKIFQLVSSLSVIQPSLEMHHAIGVATDFEGRMFEQLADKITYELECQKKLARIRETRVKQIVAFKAAVDRNQQMRNAQDGEGERLFPASKKNAKSDQSGGSSKLFVSSTISDDLTRESVKVSNLLCALRGRPRRNENPNSRTAKKGWTLGSHAFPTSLSHN